MLNKWIKYLYNDDIFNKIHTRFLAQLDIDLLKYLSYTCPWNMYITILPIACVFNVLLLTFFWKHVHKDSRAPIK